VRASNRRHRADFPARGSGPAASATHGTSRSTIGHICAPPGRSREPRRNDSRPLRRQGPPARLPTRITPHLPPPPTLVRTRLSILAPKELAAALRTHKPRGRCRRERLYRSTYSRFRSRQRRLYSLVLARFLSPPDSSKALSREEGAGVSGRVFCASCVPLPPGEFRHRHGSLLGVSCRIGGLRAGSLGWSCRRPRRG
jgi:hypothetical protein